MCTKWFLFFLSAMSRLPCALQVPSKYGYRVFPHLAANPGLTYLPSPLHRPPGLQSDTCVPQFSPLFIGSQRETMGSILY